MSHDSWDVVTPDAGHQEDRDKAGGQASGTSPLGVIACGFCAVALLAYSPSLNSLFWAPKAAAGYVIAAVGLAVLVIRFATRSASLPDRFAGAFLVVTLVSALASATRSLSIWGGYRLGTGWIFVAGLVGAWALGRALSDRDVRLVTTTIVIGIVVNIVVAVAETVTDLSGLQLFSFAGRAPALLGNPIHLGAIAAAMLAFFAARATSDGVRAGGAFATGVALQLSGSRASLAVAVAILLFVVVSHRRRAVVLGGCLILGLVAAAALPGVGETATTRAIDPAGSSGFVARSENWLSARHAVFRHPLLGTGPGTYGAATSKFRTARLARAEEPDVLFTDAHNLAVEYAVTTGFLGLLLLLAWIVTAVRDARGPLLWFALALLAGHLFQPQFAGTTPILFLALGAARQRREWHPSKVATVVLTGVAIAGLVLGGRLVVGDWALRQAELDFTLAEAHRADKMLPRWGVTADQLGKLSAYEAITHRDDAGFAKALEWRREATRREPWNPQWWVFLGELQLSRGMPSDALGSFSEALRVNPVSTRALMGRSQAELLTGDARGAVADLQQASTLATQPTQRSKISILLERARAEL